MSQTSPLLDCIGRTPLVPLSRVATGLAVFGKCEFLNPGGSVKDRIALAIVVDAEANGSLIANHQGISLIAESESGKQFSLTVG